MERRKTNKFIIGYFGGHAMSNALDTLIETAKELEGNNSVIFVLVGDGVEKNRLQKKAEGLDNVLFLPPVPKKSIPALLKQFDCVYIGAKNSTLYRFGTSMNKVYDAMMGGKPILYAVNAPNNYIVQYQCGISVEPESEDALKAGIEKMIHMNPEEREKMGINGRKAVMHYFEYGVLAQKFLEVMQ